MRPCSAALVTSIDNWELTGASISNGVALIRFKRDLITGDDLYDIPLAPELMRNFIWARGEAFSGAAVNLTTVDVAGGLLITSTRPMLNLLLLIRASV